MTAASAGSLSDGSTLITSQSYGPTEPCATTATPPADEPAAPLRAAIGGVAITPGPKLFELAQVPLTVVISVKRGSVALRRLSNATFDDTSTVVGAPSIGSTHANLVDGPW